MLLAAIAGCLLLAVVLVLLGKRAKTRRGVMIQVTETEKLGLVLLNAINTARAMPGIKLVVIVCGPAIAALERHSPMSRDIEKAKQCGIQILVCEDSMRSVQMKRTDMCWGLDYVSSALTEIVTKQFWGWVYVRA